jgi:formate dehydrogenase subunit delta
MQEADLVRMSTQIAEFFAAYPKEEAIAGIADHLRSFWAPTMREQLFAMHEAGAPPLHPLVDRAITILRTADPTA